MVERILPNLKGSCFSRASRLVMINSVISNIPSYLIRLEELFYEPGRIMLLELNVSLSGILFVVVSLQGAWG